MKKKIVTILTGVALISACITAIAQEVSCAISTTTYNYVCCVSAWDDCQEEFANGVCHRRSCGQWITHCNEAAPGQSGWSTTTWDAPDWLCNCNDAACIASEEPIGEGQTVTIYSCPDTYDDSGVWGQPYRCGTEPNTMENCGLLPPSCTG